MNNDLIEYVVHFTVYKIVLITELILAEWTLARLY